VLAGVVLLAFPGLGLVAMTFVLGIWLIIYGFIGVGRALQMRPHGTAMRSRAGPAPA
jgi:uncharacterized membrane protein HdeD (DUF308 family)